MATLQKLHCLILYDFTKQLSLSGCSQDGITSQDCQIQWPFLGPDVYTYLNQEWLLEAFTDSFDHRVLDLFIAEPYTVNASQRNSISRRLTIKGKVQTENPISVDSTTKYNNRPSFSTILTY